MTIINFGIYNGIFDKWVKARLNSTIITNKFTEWNFEPFKFENSYFENSLIIQLGIYKFRDAHIYYLFEGMRQYIM